jgi:hypothetical protein
LLKHENYNTHVLKSFQKAEYVILFVLMGISFCKIPLPSKIGKFWYPANTDLPNNNSSNSTQPRKKVPISTTTELNMVTAWSSTEPLFAYKIWVVSFSKTGDTMFTWNQHYSSRGITPWTYINTSLGPAVFSIINIIILAMGKVISLVFCLIVFLRAIFSKLGFGFFVQWSKVLFTFAVVT